MNHEQQIVSGISVSARGEATVDPSLADVLFNLAIQLEQATDLPVDVEHVLGAIVLASRSGRVDSGRVLSAEDTKLTALLTDYVRAIFTEYDGAVGADD